MSCDNKVKKLDELAILVKEFKAQGKKIVHSHGVFDLLHVGHIRHFEAGKQMGDVLVVTLTSDEHVNRGPHRPAFPQELRAEAIAALSVVDYVAINHSPSAIEAIRLFRPDVYVKGSDYKNPDQDITGRIALEIEAVHAAGGEIRFTDGITFSSSHLLNEHLSPFSEEVDQYLTAFRQRHSADEVIEWLEHAAQLRPLVVGEAIIDEYVFGETIGKSTKDPILAVLQQSVDAFAGGSLAVANHLAGLCSEVSLVTQLGEVERREEWIHSVLRSNVKAILLTKSESPTLLKLRIIDVYSGSKLLEIYRMNDQLTKDNDARDLNAALTQEFPHHDLAIVTDYGHGMLTPEAITLLCDLAPFLAVNVQSNAGNRGFNPISKYHRADYICLANHEMEVEARQRAGNAEGQLLAFEKQLACQRFTVTLGKNGSLHYDARSGFVRAPSLATRVLDRVGAGDAVLAVTALLAKLNAPWDIIAFVGNVAGAQLVAELGNAVSLEKVGLSKHITALLK